ncbi:putative Dynactin Arp1 p62 subunit RO2 [Taphrina deformans PYCC 5710]|uniref:Dynactin subunit 4 n=1 Tax=Taphrina deformans (strain PYCC 5710 / ATCC 11124 / CBS 356.35 / IMI 108563 / JCM 9778 / NBRC 8474) TaxID=1097556 RepID=R4XGU2_TAPDE|nr:putative Dynactin Arp1 p62 subunit RO2 [Taphrina deformans PYCC 5710]|eukprot:CCG82596.1 putative Dynactin Arp1 p62 subunit RO2 [Taphrina deformans PYCC 5710]
MNLTTALYHCPCYKSPADHVDHIASTEVQDERSSVADDTGEIDAHLSLTDRRIPYSLFSIEELYYCDDCNTHRCPRCVTEEVVSVYCPTCLFEVPGKTSVSGSVYEATCPRNCFRCPCCQTSLQTLGDEEEGYRLKCQYCHWSTVEASLKFRKPTGIKQQVASQITNEKKKRFDLVRKALKAEQEGILQAEDEGTRLYRQYQRAMGTPMKDDSEPYVAPILSSTEETDSHVRDLLSLESLDTLSIDSSTTCHAQEKSTLSPLPTPLRSKRTKRCRQCRLLLVKPDPRPTSLHFRSRLYARTVLPTIELYSSDPSPRQSSSQPTVSPPTPTPTPAQSASKWFIAIKNALPDLLHVTLATANKTPDGHRVVISTPHLRIGGHDEAWDREQESVTRGVGGELAWSTRNQAAVLIEVSPPPTVDARGQESAEHSRGVQFAVFVKTSWEVDREHGGDRKDSESSTGKVKRELGFWVVLDTAVANPRPKKTLR